MNQKQKIALGVGLALFLVAALFVVPYSRVHPNGMTIATARGTMWNPPVHPPRELEWSETKGSSLDRIKAVQEANPTKSFPMTISAVPYTAQVLVVVVLTVGVVAMLKDKKE